MDIIYYKGLGEAQAQKVPDNQSIYKIDWFTRQFENIPIILGTVGETSSEIIWFEAKKNYDGKDLSNLSCVIKYKNSLNETHTSIGQIYQKWIQKQDSEELIEDPDNILIAWTINSSITVNKGKVSFQVSFFNINEEEEYDFILSTTIATSQILNTLQLSLLDEDDTNLNNDKVNELNILIQQVTNLQDNLLKEWEIYSS